MLLLRGKSLTRNSETEQKEMMVTEVVIVSFTFVFLLTLGVWFVVSWSGML